MQYAKVFPIPEKLAKLDLQPAMGMNFLYILEYYLAVLGDARGKDYSEQKNKFLGGFAEMGNALVFCLRLEQTLAQLKDFNFGIHAERLPKTAGMNQVLCAKITYSCSLLLCVTQARVEQSKASVILVWLQKSKEITP